MNARHCSNSAAVSPGKPIITSAPMAASGIQRASLLHAVLVMTRAVLAVHPAQNRSDPDCSGACTCLAMRPDPATRPSRSSLQSIGSMELSRRRSTEVSSSSRRRRPLKRISLLPGPLGSRPQRPRLMPLSTTSRYCAPGHAPDHHLIRRHAAATPAHERNNTKRAAVVAAILNFEIGPGAVARRVLHRRGRESRAAQKCRRCESGRGREHVIESADFSATISGIFVLCEFPITQCTPGITASSSGARCA